MRVRVHGSMLQNDVGNKRLRDESVHAVYTVSRTGGRDAVAML